MAAEDALRKGPHEAVVPQPKRRARPCGVRDPLRIESAEESGLQDSVHERWQERVIKGVVEGGQGPHQHRHLLSVKGIQNSVSDRSCGECLKRERATGARGGGCRERQTRLCMRVVKHVDGETVRQLRDTQREGGRGWVGSGFGLRRRRGSNSRCNLTLLGRLGLGLWLSSLTAVQTALSLRQGKASERGTWILWGHKLLAYHMAASHLAG